MSGSLLNVRSHIQDLGHLQVFVYPVSDISGELYHRIYNFLRDNSSLFVMPHKGLTSNPGLLGPVRALYNFQRHLAPWSYSVKYNKFMAHKQLSGLVGVAQCSELSQVQSIHETVYSISNCYKGAVCHSVCLVFCSTEMELYSPSEPSDTSSSLRLSLEEAFSRLNTPGIEYILISISDMARDESFDDHINYHRLEEVLACFTLALNSSLQSRRQGQINLLKTENFDAMNKLKSPFEDADTEIKDRKLLMKQYRARVFKHIADLSLQCGHCDEALRYYMTAAEQLKATQDWIWLGAACEGLAATAYIMEIRDTIKTVTLVPPPTYEVSIPLSASSYNLKDSTEMLSVDDLDVRGFPEDDSTSLGEKGSFGIDAVNSALMPDLSKPVELKRDYVGSKFTECITYYHKAGLSGSIPQMEALLKLARYLLEQNRKLDAHTQLRRIMELQCSLDGVLKMELLSGIAELYREMGFHRLAGIYYKWAVTCCGKDTTLEYANKAYRMLELALPGYNLEMKNGYIQAPSKDRGWPLLQSQILYLMFNVCRRNRKESLTIRHLHSLLNAYSPYMVSEQVSNLFDRYKKRKELIKEGNKETPYKYQLSAIPRVSFFRPSPLLPHLLPKFNLKVESAAQKCKTGDNGSNTKVFWIQNHNCPTNVSVSNFLPVELNIPNMRLITSGPACELSKTGFYLPPFCDSHSFNLPCKPLQEGKLRILGYCYELFEIEHRVLFPNPKPYLEVDVLPYLPMLTTTINFPSELLDGEKLEDYQITIEALEGITSFLEVNFVWPAGTKEYLQVIFDKSVISRLIPLTPDTTRALPVTLQVSLPSKDRIIRSDYDPPTVHNRTMSNISNESSSSQLVGHNQILFTPLSDTDRSAGFKSHKLVSKSSYQRIPTVHTPILGEEKSLISSVKRVKKTRSGSLTRSAAKVPQARTPEISSLGLERNWKTKSITNIKNIPKNSPTSASATNLLDEEHACTSASRESLDSLGRGDQLKYVNSDKQQVGRRNSISIQDDFPDVASPLLHPSTGGGLHKSVSQLSFNTIFQSKFSSFPERPKTRSVEGEIQIKYSGEISYCKGYYRDCIGKIKFQIKPSLLFGFFDIIPFPSNARMCSFCFSVFNMSKEAIKLTCSITQKSVLDDLESKREVTLLPTSCKRLQIDIWKFHLVKPEDCANWELSTEHDERCGETSLQGFELTRNMLINLKSEPICYDLQVNDCIILPDDENKFLTGHPSQLCIILSNYTNIDIGPITVTLKIYEDNLESLDSESTGKATVWPTSSWTIDLLSKQSRHSIICKVLFFYHGTYKLRVICTHAEKSENPATSQSQHYLTHRHQVQELSYKMFTDMNQLYFSEYSRTKPLVSPKLSVPLSDAWSPSNFWLYSPYYTFNIFHKNFMVV